MGIQDLLLPAVAADMGGNASILVGHGHREDVGVDSYQAAHKFRGHRIPVAPEPDLLAAFYLGHMRDTGRRQLLRHPPQTGPLLLPELLHRPAKTLALTGVPPTAVPQVSIRLGKTHDP